MTWVTPPTFTNGETTGVTAALNVVSNDLVALNSSLQINSITTSPLAGSSPPSLNTPSFRTSVDYNTVTTDGSGLATCTFHAGAFPNGVLVVITASGSSAPAGLVISLHNASVTTSGFTATCYYETGGNFEVCTDTQVVIQWIAVGW